MTSYLIVEDEAPAARRLQRIVEEIKPEFFYLGCCESIESTIEFLNSNSVPDLVFMDIHLADGISFTIFEKVEFKSAVIFTTAYDNYAINAFKVDSIDYLLKPINTEELKNALKRFESRSNQAFSHDIKSLINNIQQEKSFRNRILITKADRLLPIGVQDIAWLAAEAKGLIMMMNSHEKHAINFTLDELQSQLNPQDFFRVNRSVIAHRNSIIQAALHFNGKIKLQIRPEIESEIMVSRDRAADFKLWFGS